MAKVTMPQLGESVAEGTIGKWLKQPGDHVDKYEPLVEVITDKVNAEVPSPFEGVLREILAEEGATVPNNAEIAVIETSDEGGDAAASASPAPAAADAPKTESAPEPAAPSPVDEPAPAAEAPICDRPRGQRRAGSARGGRRQRRTTGSRPALRPRHQPAAIPTRG